MMARRLDCRNKTDPARRYSITLSVLASSDGGTHAECFKVAGAPRICWWAQERPPASHP